MRCQGNEECEGGRRGKGRRGLESLRSSGYRVDRPRREEVIRLSVQHAYSFGDDTE